MKHDGINFLISDLNLTLSAIGKKGKKCGADALLRTQITAHTMCVQAVTQLGNLNVQICRLIIIHS